MGATINWGRLPIARRMPIIRRIIENRIKKKNNRSVQPRHGNVKRTRIITIGMFLDKYYCVDTIHGALIIHIYVYGHLDCGKYWWWKLFVVKNDVEKTTIISLSIMERSGSNTFCAWVEVLVYRFSVKSTKRCIVHYRYYYYNYLIRNQRYTNVFE